MSDKTLPATDAEVTALKECLVRFDAGEVTMGGPQFASGCERLIARIEADREASSAKDALIAELVQALEKAAKTFRAYAGKHYAKLTTEGHEKGSQNLYYAEEIEIILAKAKEAGQ